LSLIIDTYNIVEYDIVRITLLYDFLYFTHKQKYKKSEIKF